MKNTELRLYIRKIIQEGWGGVFNYGPPTEDNPFSSLNADEYPDFFDGAANPLFKSKPYPARTAIGGTVNGDGPYADLFEESNSSNENLYIFKTTKPKIWLYNIEDILELPSIVNYRGEIMPPNMDTETEGFVIEWGIDIDRLRNGDGIYSMDIYIKRIYGTILWKEWVEDKEEPKKGQIEFDTDKDPYTKYKVSNDIEIKEGGQVVIKDVDIDFKRKEITVN